MLNEKSIKYIHHTNSLNKYTEIQAEKSHKKIAKKTGEEIRKETNLPRLEEVSYYFFDEYKRSKNVR